MTINSDEAFLWQPSRNELTRYLEHTSGDFYVFHKEQFRKNCQRFESTFKKYYTNTRIAYSVKTNYLPQMISEIDSLGWYSEAVSGFEYDLAQSLKIEEKNIIFNGPIKTQDELSKAIRGGATINIDSVGELDRIEYIAVANKTVAKLGVRLNFSSALDSDSRFGLPADDTTVSCIQKIIDSEYLEFNGLHVHYCFSGKKPEKYTELVEAVIEFLDTKCPQLWSSLKTLNFGGGFFSSMPDKMAKNWGGKIPSFDDYAQAITTPLNQRLEKDKLPAPQLILEPGLAVVADAMSFVCRVDSVKTNIDPACAILTGSVYNIKPTKSAINLPWIHYQLGSKPIHLKGYLTGFTCMEDDILDSDFDGSIAPNDAFVFGNVGAYTIVLQPSFIRLAPAVLALEDGEIITLVNPQTNQEFIKNRFYI